MNAHTHEAEQNASRWGERRDDEKAGGGRSFCFFFFAFQIPTTMYSEEGVELLLSLYFTISTRRCFWRILCSATPSDAFFSSLSIALSVAFLTTAAAIRRRKGRNVCACVRERGLKEAKWKEKKKKKKCGEGG